MTFKHNFTQPKQKPKEDVIEESVTLKPATTAEKQEVETVFTLKPMQTEEEEIQEQITLKPKKKKPQVVEETSEELTIKVVLLMFALKFT